MMQFISKHDECEKYAQHKYINFYISFHLSPRVGSAYYNALSDNE